MKNVVYTTVMLSFAIMMSLVFTAGALMAASQDENLRTMGSGSVQGNVNDQTTTRMPGQQQTGVSGGMQSGVAGQTETSTPSHVRTDISGRSDQRSQAQPNPNIAVQPKPDLAVQPNPNIAVQPNPDLAVQPNPNIAVQPNPDLAVQPNPSVVTQPTPGVAAQPGTPMQQPAAVTGHNAGTPAIVARVDRPDNCLRIRSGPSKSSNVIGCANMGDQLFLTGVFSDDGRWVQLSDNGWVSYNQVQTSLRTKRHMRAAIRPRVSEDFDSEDVDTWENPAGTSYEEEPVIDSSYGYYGYSPGHYGGDRGHGGYRTFGSPYGYGSGPGIGFGFRVR